jgi:septal ring factor EnvC (AmiA/AmiB activator)
MSEQASRYTKEELEKQKLLVEIANLKKSWIKNPASWVSIMTIVLALFGLAFQYRNHQFEAKAAEDNLNKVKADLMKVQDALNQKEPQLKQVDEELAKATDDLKQLASEREDAQKQLATLNDQLKDLEAKAASLPKTADNQKIQESVKLASVAIIDLQKKNQSIVDKSKSLSDSLARAKDKSSVAAIDARPAKDRAK